MGRGMSAYRERRAHRTMRARYSGRRPLIVVLLLAFVALLVIPGGNAHADQNPPPPPPPRIALPGYDITQIVNQVVPFYYTPVPVLHRALTDNGSCYRSKAWAKALEDTGTTHKRTRPYTPRTNG